MTSESPEVLAQQTAFEQHLQDALVHIAIADALNQIDKLPITGDIQELTEKITNYLGEITNPCVYHEPEDTEPIPNVEITEDSITIDYGEYTLYPGEAELLRIIVTHPTEITGPELAQILIGPNPPDRDTETIEEELFRLSKRGILIESTRVVNSYIIEQYQLNPSPQDTLANKTEVFIDNKLLVLDQFDTDILKALYSQPHPLSLSDISRVLSPGKALGNDKYDQLARTVKKYFYPLKIVGKQKAQGGGSPKFYLINTPLIGTIFNT